MTEQYIVQVRGCKDIVTLLFPYLHACFIYYVTVLSIVLSSYFRKMTGCSKSFFFV